MPTEVGWDVGSEVDVEAEVEVEVGVGWRIDSSLSSPMVGG